MHRGFQLWAVLCLAAIRLAAEGTVVLPFANAAITKPANSGTNVDWIGESVADTIREALMSRSVTTIGRDDLKQAFKSLRLVPLAQLSQGSVLKLGQTLRADFIIYGTLTYQAPKPLPAPPPVAPTPAATPGSTTPPAATPPPAPKQLGKLTIRARFTNRMNLQQSPELEESGPLEDLATMEAHLAWSALKFIAPDQTPPETDFRTLRGPIRLDVQENFIRGLLATNSEQQEKFFKQAAKVDPKFWRPPFELGKIYIARKQYKDAATWLTKVEPPATHQREQKFYLGVAKLNAGDYVAAQDIFTALVAHDPTAENFNNLGVAESRRGQTHALESFRQALNANPSDPDYHFNFGYMLWKTGQFEPAADRFRAVLDRVPTDAIATRLLGRALQQQGPQNPKTNKDAAADLNLERPKNRFELMVMSATVLVNPKGALSDQGGDDDQIKDDQ
ncbi:MAG: tetratricopeptide repeat protein [Acidobacteriota bacterium]